MAYQGWRHLALAGGVLTDTNSTLVSLTDNGDGSWTAVLDDAYATTDPAAGAVVAFPMLDPTGQALTECRSMEWTIVVTAHPANGSDVAVVAGGSQNAALSSEYFYGGIDHSSATGPSRGYGYGGSWATAGASAVTGGVYCSMAAKRYANNSGGSPHTGRVCSMKADGDGNGEGSVTPASTTEWPTPYFFVSIMRTATGGGNASITFYPSYATPMAGSIPGLT